MSNLKVLSQKIDMDVVGHCFKGNCYKDYNALKNWMSRIEDSKNILELSIPGTHDSGTFTSARENHARTQVLSITEQLNMGIRFLDIRVYQTSDKHFAIHHGIIYLGYRFEQILTNVTKFLSEYPTEVVLMKIKAEDGKQNAKFQEILEMYIKEYNSYIWNYNNNVNPALGDARGKIIIIQDFDTKLLRVDTNQLYGLNYGKSFQTFKYYKIDTDAELDKKKRKILDFVKRAMRLSKGVMNSLTGNGWPWKGKFYFYVN